MFMYEGVLGAGSGVRVPGAGRQAGPRGNWTPGELVVVRFPGFPRVCVLCPGGGKDGRP